MLLFNCSIYVSLIHWTIECICNLYSISVKPWPLLFQFVSFEFELQCSQVHYFSFVVSVYKFAISNTLPAYFHIVHQLANFKRILSYFDMNSFAKFQAKSGMIQPAGSQPKLAAASKPTQNQEINDRILTVDIKMMRTHLRDETNFNNPHIILEVFGKCSSEFYYYTTFIDVHYTMHNVHCTFDWTKKKLLNC